MQNSGFAATHAVDWLMSHRNLKKSSPASSFWTRRFSLSGCDEFATDVVEMPKHKFWVTSPDAHKYDERNDTTIAVGEGVRIALLCVALLCFGFIFL